MIPPNLAELTGCPISVNPHDCESVSRDEWRGGDAVIPLAVAQPTNADQVGRVLAVTHAHRIPVVVRGGGTSTTGAALPVANGLVLDLSRLNRWIELDPINQCVTVEPGLILTDLHQWVESAGWFYPPDPASLSRCTIGGTVVQNAGGPRCVKYGVTRDYVMGLSGFYPDGTPFSWGGKLRKNVAGLDLIGLMVGSEGILGVITKMVLRVIPKPACRETQLLGVSSLDAALGFLLALRQKGLTPAVMDYFPDACRQAVASIGMDVGLLPPHPHYVILEWDGDQRGVAADREVCETYAQACSFTPIDIPSESLWNIRRAMSFGLRMWGKRKQSHDITLPLSEVAGYMDAIQGIAQKCGVLVVGYGHLGDGNIHLNILGPNITDLEWDHVLDMVTDQAIGLALQCGGTLSGEHGIGLAKKRYMSSQFSTRDLAVMRGIKSVLDPEGLLNPGKMLP